MCFTIEIKLTRDAIENRFSADASDLSDFEYRYFYRAFENPLIPVITLQDPGRVKLMRWGLIPHWIKDEQTAIKIRSGTYNARAESLDDRPSFTKAYRDNRCFVIAHGFFEWQHREERKIPWYIKRADNQPFVFAGLFDQWHNPSTGSIENTFSIITTKADGMMEKIHNTKKRMPVILDPRLERSWLNKEFSDDLAKLLISPVKGDKLIAWTVKNTLVLHEADANNPSVIEPYEYGLENRLF